MKITDIESPLDIARECGKNWRPVLYVDWEHGTVEIRGKHESDTSWTFREHHGHEDSYRIDGVDALLLRAGLEEIQPLIDAACEQYESYWDGSNHRARFLDLEKIAADSPDGYVDAHPEGAVGAAREAIRDLVDGLRAANVGFWDAGDWFAYNSAEQLGEQYGITAETTDEELQRVAETIVSDGEAEGVLLDEGDCYRVAEYTRDDLREAAEDDEDDEDDAR